MFFFKNIKFNSLEMIFFSMALLTLHTWYSNDNVSNFRLLDIIISSIEWLNGQWYIY